LLMVEALLRDAPGKSKNGFKAGAQTQFWRVCYFVIKLCDYSSTPWTEARSVFRGLGRKKA
jgi:hypothetical protein